MPHLFDNLNPSVILWLALVVILLAYLQIAELQVEQEEFEQETHRDVARTEPHFVYVVNTQMQSEIEKLQLRLESLQAEVGIIRQVSRDLIPPLEVDVFINVPEQMESVIGLSEDGDEGGRDDNQDEANRQTSFRHDEYMGQYSEHGNQAREHLRGYYGSERHCEDETSPPTYGRNEAHSDDVRVDHSPQLREDENQPNPHSASTSAPISGEGETDLVDQFDDIGIEWLGGHRYDENDIEQLDGHRHDENDTERLGESRLLRVDEIEGFRFFRSPIGGNFPSVPLDEVELKRRRAAAAKRAGGRISVETGRKSSGRRRSSLFTGCSGDGMRGGGCDDERPHKDSLSSRHGTSSRATDDDIQFSPLSSPEDNESLPVLTLLQSISQDSNGKDHLEQDIQQEANPTHLQQQDQPPPHPQASPKNNTPTQSNSPPPIPRLRGGGQTFSHVVHAPRSKYRVLTDQQAPREYEGQLRLPHTYTLPDGRRTRGTARVYWVDTRNGRLYFAVAEELQAEVNRYLWEEWERQMR